ncbi:MAG: hypothetical protein AAF281_09505, partial [Pseudomonadota bacterium]
MSDDVVTLYFCGSGNHRDKDDKFAIPRLYKETKGDRRIIFDGPGGAAIPRTEALMKAVESGGNIARSPRHRTHSSAWDAMLQNKHGTMTTGATGVGTQSNIVMALQWLWEKWYEAEFSDINLAGFSRGAVSCIMLAHSIQAAGFPVLRPMRVNIFTFDPVPGGKNDFKNKGTFGATGRAGDPTTLAPCVASYRSILQENISKRMMGVIPKDKNFKCVVPTYTGGHADRTVQELFPMPGKHSDGSKYAQRFGPGEIGMHLAQEFLEAHGTEFKTSFKRTDRDLIETYAVIRGNYTDTGRADGGKLSPSKYRAPLVSNPLRDHDFYINAHHEDLMLRNHGELYRAIATATTNP